MKSVPYLSAVGSLMYLAVGTRPDISFAVGALSRFNANPGKAHWKQVQHVFKYLASTKDLMLCYGPGQDGTSLQIYSDADYAGDVDSACSTSGHTVFIGRSLVTWSSKQHIHVDRNPAIEYKIFLSRRTIWSPTISKVQMMHLKVEMLNFGVHISILRCHV